MGVPTSEVGYNSATARRGDHESSYEHVVALEKKSFFLNRGARWGWVVYATPRPLYPWERPGTHCVGSGWAPWPVWTGAENLALTGIRSPDRPACSESLYRLRYPGPHIEIKWWEFSPLHFLPFIVIPVVAATISALFYCHNVFIPIKLVSTVLPI